MGATPLTPTTTAGAHTPGDLEAGSGPYSIKQNMVVRRCFRCERRRFLASVLASEITQPTKWSKHQPANSLNARGCVV